MVGLQAFAAQNRKKRGEGKPETFTFLGFTHYCGKRRKDGAFIVWRATAKKRMAAKLLAIKAELIRRRHQPKAAHLSAYSTPKRDIPRASAFHPM